MEGTIVNDLTNCNYNYFMKVEDTLNMGKIGILTRYYKNYNFGGLLQAYALPKVLMDNFEMDAEQIKYSPFVEKIGKNFNKSTYSGLYGFIYKVGICFFAKITKKKLNTRKSAFKQFMEEIPHSQELYDDQSIGECLPNYHTLICGGDQIWNVCNGIQNLNVFTLNFAPANTRKIAYAPSMAILEMDGDGKRCMEQGLSELKAVSVREKRSIDILKTITDKQIEIVVDPVLLLQADAWCREAKQPKIKNKYILCYLLSDNVMQRKAVEKIAKKLQLQIVTFPHILGNVVRKCDLFFGDIHDYTSGPREFLGLIKNAELVVTDSFHACVFSMIFQTTFVVLERHQVGEKGNMNSRIYDFTEEYHLEEQIVTVEGLTNMDEIPNIDFTYAHAHWKKRREASLEYLEKALKQ